MDLAAGGSPQEDRAEPSCPPPTAAGCETSPARLAHPQRSRRMALTHQHRLSCYPWSKVRQQWVRNSRQLRARQQRFRHQELGPSAPAPAPAPALATPAPALAPTTDEMVELVLRDVEVAPGPALGEGLDIEDTTLDDVLEIMAQLEYHTHAEDGVDICSDFLLARCFSGASCPQHHTRLPFHWQLWHTASLPPRWHSLGPEAQETLERIYSDPERTHVRASYQGVAFDIDLVDMNVLNSSYFTRARRLSTSATPGTPFRATQAYYWKSLAGWQKYSEPFIQSIEAALEAGQEEALCSTDEHSYQLHLRAGYQRNVATGTVRPLRIRPNFRSPALLVPELRTLSDSLGQDLAPLPASETSHYPETWLPMTPQQDWLTVPMALGDRRFRVVYRLFHKSLPETQYRIVDVSRVQNRFLWDKYMRKQSHMSRTLSREQWWQNERHLFHGTEASAVAAICKHNLDPRLAGKHATLYGQGSYFARQASYSHRYAPASEAGLRHVFLCKVLVGRSALGQPALRRPPPLDPSDPASDLYNSCVDSLSDPQIYVVFDNDQYYPYFIIRYRELENVVQVD